MNVIELLAWLVVVAACAGVGWLVGHQRGAMVGAAIPSIAAMAFVVRAWLSAGRRTWHVRRDGASVRTRGNTVLVLDANGRSVVVPTDVARRAGLVRA